MAVRGPGWATGAILTLEGIVDGPVHPPHSPGAAVEIALGPPPPTRTLRRVVVVVGATGTADVVRVVGWAAEDGIEIVVLGGGGEREARSGDPPGRRGLALARRPGRRRPRLGHRPGRGRRRVVGRAPRRRG